MVNHLQKAWNISYQGGIVSPFIFESVANVKITINLEVEAADLLWVEGLTKILAVILLATWLKNIVVNVCYLIAPHFQLFFWLNRNSRGTSLGLLSPLLLPFLFKTSYHLLHWSSGNQFKGLESCVRWMIWQLGNSPVESQSCLSWSNFLKLNHWGLFL